MKRNSLFFNHGIKRFLPKKIILVARIALILLFIGTIGINAADPFSSTKQKNEPNAMLQVTEVTGVVTDNEGQPLPGVSILIKGTTVGAVSDLNGNYRLEIPSGSGQPVVLVYSYIGFKVQEIAIGDQTSIDVILEVEALGLDEVVVVGYGTVRKSDLTGSLSSIKPEEILRMPTARVDQAIQGRAPGVFIMNTDGSPGGNTFIRIRGNNSIYGGNDPLVIVDGLQGASLNQINPNDIASLEILKDASATAIYGSRGANGVILITTKLGQQGKPVIDASYNVGFQRLIRKLPVMTAGEFARHNNFYNSHGTAGGATPKLYFTEEQVAHYEEHGGTDWQDQVYGTGVMHNANLSMSGGTEKLKYLISANYLDHEGIMLNSKYSRFSLRTNMEAEVTKWVDFGLNYSYTRETYKSPPFIEGDALFQVVNNTVRWAPTEPVYDALGNYWKHSPGYGAYDTWNPVATAKEHSIYMPTNQSNASLFLNFKIVEGLTLKIQGGGTIRRCLLNDYQNTKTRNGFAMNGVGKVENHSHNRLQNTNILTYDNTFGAHHLTVTGVIEQIYSETIGSEMNGQDFLVDQLMYDNMDGARSSSIDSWYSERALLSYMGRINYALLGKYLVTFSYRADGSSVFGENNKWGYFPSGSLAWRISEENFLRESSVVSNLKLRASYGITGNQGISPYGSLARLGSGSWYRYPYTNGKNLDLGFGISDIANPELKWETTTQGNIGLDLALFNGRLTSTIDVYKKVTDDLLMPRQLPGYVGVSSVISNIGSIENKGLEILIGGDPLTGRLRWNTSFNFSLNRNKVLDLGPGVERIGWTPSDGGYSLYEDYMFLEVGQPFGLMNGYKFLGFWGADEDAEARSYGKLPGTVKYADLSGPDGVPDGQIDSYDKTTIGNGYPDFIWGFTNSFNYGGIELTFLITGSHGNDLFNQIRGRRESHWEGTDPKILDYWTPENQDAQVQAIYDGAWVEEQNLENKYYTGGQQGTSQWVEDASFVRLKSLTLAYNFERELLSKIGFTRARVYFSGNNLLTFTDYTGYDPEVASFADNDATIGVDLSTYPTCKTYTFGFEFTF
jgi:TonB-linked SusC/RagA family outer membrane protein